MPSPLRRLLALASAVALLGCESDRSTGPLAATGTRYAATFTHYSIDGQLLPFVESVSGACTVLNLGGRLSLYPDGTYAWVEQERRSVCNGTFSAAGAGKNYGHYVVTGTRVELTPDVDVPGTTAMPPFVGVFTPARGDYLHGGAFGALTLSRGGHQYQMYDYDSLRPGA
jgi:hypothetical protein